jgi:hypothetical protein
METDSSVPCLQNLATDSYYDPYEWSRWMQSKSLHRSLLIGKLQEQRPKNGPYCSLMCTWETSMKDWMKYEHIYESLHTATRACQKILGPYQRAQP